MPELLNWLWQGCLLALATGVILRLGERVRSRDRHAICWAALIVVLVLPILQSISPASAIIATPPGEVALPMPSVWWTSEAMWVFLWEVWCAVFLIRSAGAVRGIRRTRAACRPFPEAVAATLSNWQMVAPRGRQARLALSSDVRSASVLGCGSPVIAVSPALVRHLDAKELDRVVVHEWAHVQRRDDLQSVAQLAVRAIAGWHPAVWWLDRQLQIEREAASDEIAVSVTRCPKAYAATLTATASLLPKRPTEPATLDALSWSRLGTRVRRILSQRRLASRGWSAGAAASAVVALCVGSLAVTGSRIAGIAAAPSAEATSGIAADRPAAPLALSATARQTAVDVPPAATTRGKLAIARSPRRQSTYNSAQLSAVSAELPALTGDDVPVAPDQLIRVPGPVPPLGGRTELNLLPSKAPASMLSAAPDRVPALARAPVQSASPWGAAADAGVAIGRTSQNAGVATAGFFSRFGKKVAASF